MNADPTLFVGAALRPALVAAVRRSDARALRGRRARRQPRRPIAVARVEPGARGVRRRRSSIAFRRRGRRGASIGASRRSPGSPTSRSGPPPIASASTRSGRSICSDGSVPRCARPPRQRRRLDASLDDVRVSRGRRSRAQLLRAARPAAAARRRRAQPGQPAGDAAADARCGATPASARSRTSPAPRRGSRPSKRRAAAARAQRGTRASAGGAERRAAGRAGGGPVAAGVSAAREGAADRRPGAAAAPASGRARRRAAARGGDRTRRRRRGRPLSARQSIPASSVCSPDAATCSGSADSRAWAVTPALSWVGFDLGSARARLRGAEAAHARGARRVRADRAAGARGGRERAGRLSRAGTSGLARRAGAREHARGRHRARPLPRGSRRLPVAARRRAHAAAGRRRRRAGRGRRLHRGDRGLQGVRRDHPASQDDPRIGSTGARVLRSKVLVLRATGSRCDSLSRRSYRVPSSPQRLQPDP